MNILKNVVVELVFYVTAIGYWLLFWFLFNIIFRRKND